MHRTLVTAVRAVVLSTLLAGAAACAQAQAATPRVLVNDLDTPVCTVQVAACGAAQSVELVTDANPMQAGDRLALPAGQCQDVFMVSCDGEEMLVLAVDEGAGRDLLASR